MPSNPDKLSRETLAEWINPKCVRWRLMRGPNCKPHKCVWCNLSRCARECIRLDERVEELEGLLERSDAANERGYHAHIALTTKHAALVEAVREALLYLQLMVEGDKEEAPETPTWFLEKILRGEPYAFCIDCQEPLEKAEWEDDVEVFNANPSIWWPTAKRGKCADCALLDDQPAEHDEGE